MKKILLLAIVALSIGTTATAQKISTKVIDNKGTIKWVIDSSTAVITKADSTILYVTPTQMKDTLTKFTRYADTANMLAPYINEANNGLTKNGQIAQLGGALIQPTTITTTAANFLAITGLQPGSNTTDSVMVVDPTSGQIKFISASSLFNALSFSNGLTKTGNSVELGGALTKSTTIGTDASNTLKVTGLQSGNLATDSLVVTAADGTLKRVTAESLLQSGDENFTATAGQSSYAVTNMPANASKVLVYRNGAKLIATTDYTTTAGNVTLASAMAALIAAGDAIEVQWVK
ncbi:MAG: VCBS domain-containing protein [Chitinophagaceae bacterium]